MTQAQKLISEDPLTERQEGIQEGYEAAIQDAEAGMLKNQGIYTTRMVKDFLEIYRAAIRQTILNDIRGVYRLGNGSGDEERVAEKLMKEADDKFSGLLSSEDQATK